MRENESKNTRERRREKIRGSERIWRLINEEIAYVVGRGKIGTNLVLVAVNGTC